MNLKNLDQRQLNALAAVLLVIAGGLFVFTETVAPAIVGLIFVVAAAVCVFMGRNRT